MSRNRLIVGACRSLVGEGRAQWPDGLFAGDHLSARDLHLLRASYGGLVTPTSLRATQPELLSRRFLLRWKDF